MIRLEQISFSYDKKEVLSNISMELKSGDMIAVLGVNGSGKTTLLKIIGGILKPNRGSVFIEGRPIYKIGRHEFAKTVAYLPQKSNGVFCSVFDAVLLGRKPHIGLEASRHDIEITGRIIEMLGLEDYAFRITTELSGGELQKVVIARALAQEPKILLLDEPINHLDIKNQLEIMILLKKITKELNITTVIVLHDLSAAMRYSDSFVLLKGGRLYAYGGREVITPHTIRDVYHIDATIKDINGIPVVVPMK